MSSRQSSSIVLPESRMTQEYEAPLKMKCPVRGGHLLRNLQRSRAHSMLYFLPYLGYRYLMLMRCSELKYHVQSGDAMRAGDVD